MNNKIIDGMKKEGRYFLYLMLIGYIGYILIPLCLYITKSDKITDKGLIILLTSGFLFGTYGLFAWLYAIKYRVEFDNEKVCLKTCL